MPFKPGDPKPPGSGLKKGQKIRVLGRKFIEELEARNINLFDLIVKELDNDDLHAHVRVKILLELLSYVYAKQKAVHHSGHVSTDHEIPPDTARLIIEMAQEFKKQK